MERPVFRPAACDQPAAKIETNLQPGQPAHEESNAKHPTTTNAAGALLLRRLWPENNHVNL
nr:hypothetical protein [uncultured Desulfobulbus sp.]